MSQAWEEVKPETISKCFRKAGVLGESFALVSLEQEDQDPFDELDCTQSSSNDLEDLIHQLDLPAESTCSVGEYTNGEDDSPTCSEHDNSWKDEFFLHHIQTSQLWSRKSLMMLHLILNHLL